MGLQDANLALRALLHLQKDLQHAQSAWLGNILNTRAHLGALCASHPTNSTVRQGQAFVKDTVHAMPPCIVQKRRGFDAKRAQRDGSKKSM